MTEKTQPTDAELWQLHMQMPGRHKDPIDFARAALARWGQPYGAGEVDRADAVNLARNCLGAHNCVITKKGMRVLAEAVLAMDAALSPPQPTQAQAGAKPLTDEQLWANDEIMSLNADLGWHMETIRMFARAIERAHGIKGGQHGAE